MDRSHEPFAPPIAEPELVRGTAVPRSQGDTEPTNETDVEPAGGLFSHQGTDLGLADSKRPKDHTDAEFTPGTLVGDILIVRLMAEGGMGRVYEGVQSQPRRRVAVKVMRSTRLSPQTIDRFRREIEVLARLVHPGIAQIHLAGSCRIDGIEIPYYVMEFVEGSRTIVDHCDGQRLGAIDRCRLMAAVCDAVAHGHSRGVVHRDIKAANVLVDFEGHPKVIDFGIARVPVELTGDTLQELGSTTVITGSEASTAPTADLTRTQHGTLLGTRRCMSPEQFAADGRPVSAASDVYSLGVLLHELLAGTPPHDLDGLSMPAAARVVAERPPRALVPRDQSIGRRCRHELAAIADRCLAKSPIDRFQTARELGDALRKAIGAAPVRQPSWRTDRWAAWKFIVVGTALAAIALVLTIGPTLVPSGAPVSEEGLPLPMGDSSTIDPRQLSVRFNNIASGRVDPLDWVGLTFDRDLATLDVKGFVLTRDGINVPLTGVRSRGQGRSWRLEGLAAVTGAGGLYRLSTRQGPLSPRGIDGMPLGRETSVSWRMPENIRVTFNLIDAGWKEHLVSIDGLECYTESKAGRETFIRPTVRGEEGSVVFRFESAFPIQDATLSARIAVWTTGDPFPYDPGAQAILDVSRDGTTWETIETRKAGHGGFGGGPFDISGTVAGGTAVWIRARLTATRDWPGDGLIYAQFLRSDSNSDEPAFSLVLVGPHPPLIPSADAPSRDQSVERDAEGVPDRSDSSQ